MGPSGGGQQPKSALRQTRSTYCGKHEASGKMAWAASVCVYVLVSVGGAGYVYRCIKAMLDFKLGMM